VSGATGNGRWPAADGLRGPLAGVKILDLSRVLAGPWATMVLGDLGADVIKIESPDGDVTRIWGPPFVESTAVYFLSANRSKRSVVLDLATEAGRATALALAAEADVVIENFRAGGAAKFGLAYDDVRALNPACVYCSVTGFGAGSPREQEPAYDLVVQAIGGMMGVTGVEGEPPVKVGVATADLFTGLYATSAILAALLERTATGAGRQIEVALIDAQLASLANQALNWLAAGFNPPRLGSDHPNVAPYGAYDTGTDHIVVAVGNDRQFGELADALGHPAWVGDPRFASNEARVAHRDELRAELQAVLRTRTADAWLAELRARGVPCGPVRDIAAVFADPDVQARSVRTVADSAIGPVPQVLSPFRFDGEPTPITQPPPGLGEHTAEVLAHLDTTEGGSR
jgi:crotonobetainyl-CoA:carnitine CoA-transferase CaiB-like acyl-CoA transferase